jgi:hypothetical protein
VFIIHNGKDLVAIVAIHSIPKLKVLSSGMTGTVLNLRIVPAANYQIQLNWNNFIKKSKND